MTELEKLQMQRNMEDRDQGNYDMLISAIKEIDLTEQEVNTLAWLSTYEKASINICRIIEKIKILSNLNDLEK